MAVKVEMTRCIGCENCAAICPTGAIQVEDGKASVKEQDCVECCACIYDCPMDAITLRREDSDNGKD
ncbi:MAG: 4Fe-4S dicluster domain-containing protein [Acidaminococcaceae bacterium]|nr:4Fe-4S dicluster domain-containing protein [Acidaminococcaceae bacterium]